MSQKTKIAPLNPSASALNVQLVQDLTDVLDSLGTDAFYHAAAKLVADVLHSERFMVVRYAQFVKPQFLVNQALSRSAMQHYERSLYRIDPLLRMARSGAVTKVQTFEQLKLKTTDQVFFEENYSTAEIKDEMVVMLPALGGVWTAICVDRNLEDKDSSFLPAEVDQVKSLYPMLERLHQLHIDRCLFEWGPAYLNDSEIAMMIVDSSENVIFRNSNWQTALEGKSESYLLSNIDARNAGHVMLDADMVVHWQRLPDNNSVAPKGFALLLEKRAPGYLDTNDNQLIREFANAYNLTPKETEIVSFILRGVPPSLIAEKMGVSVGTIRNHKYRLYYKLDISTEREMFSTFISMFLRERG